MRAAPLQTLPAPCACPARARRPAGRPPRPPQWPPARVCVRPAPNSAPLPAPPRQLLPTPTTSAASSPRQLPGQPWPAPSCPTARPCWRQGTEGRSWPPGVGLVAACTPRHPLLSHLLPRHARRSPANSSSALSLPCPRTQTCCAPAQAAAVAASACLYWSRPQLCPSPSATTPTDPHAYVCRQQPTAAPWTALASP
jgi:hypothetical protein